MPPLLRLGVTTLALTTLWGCVDFDADLATYCRKSGRCEASCGDGIRNGTESDVDCGGSCGACDVGEACTAASDCTTSLCAASVCVAPACTDGVKNGSETDVDCGGAGCAPCDTNRLCSQPSDCGSRVCDAAGRCAAPNCIDGAKNGAETDVDCGGSCARCADGRLCLGAVDCSSGVCGSDLRCAPPSCSDSIKNGNETLIDCGGGCPCANGQTCAAWGDCQSGYCPATVCIACTSSTQCALSRPCVAGACIACTSGSQCAQFQACIAGSCGSCSADGHCDTGFVCRESFCVRNRSLALPVGAAMQVVNKAGLLAGNSHTVEMWLKVRGTGVVFDKWVQSAEDKRVSATAGGFVYNLFGSVATSSTANFSVAGPSSWHHLAVCSDPGGQMRVYVDGARLVDQTRLLTVANSTGDLYFGKNIARDLDSADITLSDVRVSSSCRYGGTSFTPKKYEVLDGNTQALWRMDQESGATVTDLSPNASHGALSGPYQWVVDRP